MRENRDYGYMTLTGVAGIIIGTIRLNKRLVRLFVVDVYGKYHNLVLFLHFVDIFLHIVSRMSMKKMEIQHLRD